MSGRVSKLYQDGFSGSIAERSKRRRQTTEQARQARSDGFNEVANAQTAERTMRSAERRTPVEKSQRESCHSDDELVGLPVRTASANNTTTSIKHFTITVPELPTPEMLRMAPVSDFDFDASTEVARRRRKREGAVGNSQSVGDTNRGPSQLLSAVPQVVQETPPAYKSSSNTTSTTDQKSSNSKRSSASSPLVVASAGRKIAHPRKYIQARSTVDQIEAIDHEQAANGLIGGVFQEDPLITPQSTAAGYIEIESDIENVVALKKATGRRSKTAKAPSCRHKVDLVSENEDEILQKRPSEPSDSSQMPKLENKPKKKPTKEKEVNRVKRKEESEEDITAAVPVEDVDLDKVKNDLEPATCEQSTFDQSMTSDELMNTTKHNETKRTVSITGPSPPIASHSIKRPSLPMFSSGARSRAGLSKRARIEPLHKIVRRD